MNASENDGGSLQSTFSGWGNSTIGRGFGPRFLGSAALRGAAVGMARCNVPDRSEWHDPDNRRGARTDANGPMQVVSGPIGRERVHYQAPSAAALDREMAAFIGWFESEKGIDPVLKAGIARLWFVTVHPFDDGNGRIARVIADLGLARSEGSAQRFYSMSMQIRAERKAYYDLLEMTQKADLDTTSWLEWFLDCLDRAFDGRAGPFLGSRQSTLLGSSSRDVTQ